MLCVNRPLLGFVTFGRYLLYTEKSAEYTGVKFEASVAAFSLIPQELQVKRLKL